MPFTLSLLEMGLNKLYLDHRHSILVFLATVLYLVVNWLGSLGPDSREAYPSLLHWEQISWLSIGVFTVGSTSLSAGMVAVH
jgi:hypothetical protein